MKGNKYLPVIDHARYTYFFVCMLLMCSLGFKPLYGQHPLATKITPSDSYLPTTAFYVFRDKSDIMWIATNTGVYRYNGYTFDHFTSADGLGDNEILRIFQDSKERIWFQSVNGNTSYYLHGKIYNASNDKLAAQLRFTRMILSESEDSAGNIYIGSRGFKYYHIDPDDRVTALKYDGHENYMWIGQDDQPHFISRDALSGFRPVRGSILDTLNLVSQLQSIYKIIDDTIYTKLFTLPEGYEEIISLKIKSPEEIYIGTRDGLLIWDITGKHPMQHILRGYSVSSVAFDYEGNTWISTLEAGVYMIANMRVFQYDARSGLPEDKITCLEHDKNGNLWIGMANDKYARLDNTGSITSYTMPSASRLDITNIRVHNDTLYIIGKSGIMRRTRSGEKHTDVYGNDLLFTDKGKVFLGQDNAVMLTRDEYEHHLEEIVFNMRERSEDYELINARTNVLKYIGNTVYIGTSRGLFAYDTTLTEFGKADKAFSYPVRDIVFNETDDLLYIATMNGLVIADGMRIIKIIGTGSGLPNSECNAVFIDKSNTIWAAFGNQIAAIHKTGDVYQITNFSARLKIDASRITDIDAAHGNIYVATENGLICFDPDNAPQFNTKPILFFDVVLVNGKPYNSSFPVNFSYNENDITISYTGMSFTSRNRMTYRYYLSGYDTEWHYTGDRSIHFKSLPPGSYEFLVAATNTSGVSGDIQRISFTIKKPIWQEWWFIALVTAAGIILLILIWLRRVKQLRRDFEQQERTVRLEKDKAEAERLISELNQQAFRQQMNPHFIFNALNTIKGYYAENDVKKASDYISKFSKLLRNILENSAQVVPIEKEINAITLYLDLAAMRYEHTFVYSILTGPELNIHEIAIPPMLIQPFLENAIVHGIAPKQGKGTILIEFMVHDQKLCCYITDDGIGRLASGTRSRISEHSSKATLLITEYLHALNRREKTDTFTLNIEDLTDKNGNPLGTRVKICMPLITVSN